MDKVYLVDKVYLINELDYIECYVRTVGIYSSQDNAIKALQKMRRDFRKKYLSVVGIRGTTSKRIDSVSIAKLKGEPRTVYTYIIKEHKLNTFL